MRKIENAVRQERKEPIPEPPHRPCEPTRKEGTKESGRKARIGLKEEEEEAESRYP
jgi:hypothetical protein